VRCLLEDRLLEDGLQGSVLKFVRSSRRSIA
jgi:hypothetical protein